MLTDKPKGKRPLGSLRRRWEEIIRMDLIEISMKTKNRDCWRALVIAALNLRVPQAMELVKLSK
jgi:hypothetical protein